MKKFLFAATALLLSTAAVAQMPPGQGWNGGPPPPGAGPGWNHGPDGDRDRGRGWDGNAFWRGAPDSPRDRIEFLQDRINRGRADGSLNRHEAMRVSGELNGLRHWIQRMHWQDQGRLTPDQRGQVQARLDQISQQIRWMRHNGW